MNNHGLVLAFPVFLTGIAVLLLLPVFVGTLSPSALLLCFAYLIVCVFVIKSEEVSADLLSPLVFYVLYHSLVKDVWPTLAVAMGGFDAHAALRDFGRVALDSVLVKKLLLTVLALLGFWVGYVLVRPLSIVGRISFRAPTGLVWKLLILVAVSGVVLFLYAKAVGGFSDLLLERGRDRADRYASRVGGHYAFAMNIGVVASLYFFFVSSTRGHLAVFFPSYLVSVLIVYLSTGSRSFVIAAVVMLILVYFVKSNRLPYWRILLAAVMLVAFVGVGGEFRKAQRGAVAVSDISVDVSVLESLKLGLEDYSQRSSYYSGELGVIGKVPSTVSYLYGESYLAFLAAPIPRAVWPEKPRAGGFQTARLVFERDDTAIPPGSVGELYFNFGVPGVFLGMLVFGVFMRLVYARCRVGGGAASTIFLVLTLVYLQPNTESMNAWLRMVAILGLVAFCFSGFPKIKRTV